MIIPISKRRRARYHPRRGNRHSPMPAPDEYDAPRKGSWQGSMGPPLAARTPRSRGWTPQACVWVAIGCGRIMNAPLEIAELVEHEQRVVAVTAEVSVPRRALLSSVGWALGTIHVEN